MQTKPWLNEMSWDALVAINQSLCESQKVPAQPNEDNHQAKELWEKSHTQAMDLEEAFDVCKRCNHLSPFTFNNGNTFAAVSWRLVEDWMEFLPSFEAHMLRTAIGHYVNGLISKSELLATLRHAETTWKSAYRGNTASP